MLGILVTEWLSFAEVMSLGEGFTVCVRIINNPKVRVEAPFVVL